MLVFLLKRAADRLSYLSVFTGFRPKFVQLIQLRRRVILKMVKILLNVKSIPNCCLQQTIETRDYLLVRLPLPLKSLKHYNALLEKLKCPIFRQEGSATEKVDIARTLIMSPIYPSAGDRYAMTGPLDDMSPVYQAVDTFTGAKVAIKLMHRGISSLHEIEMSQLANRLAPQGTVKLLAVETAPPTGEKSSLAIVMELCSQSLFSRLQRLPETDVPLEFIVEIFSHVSDTLAKLHSGDFIHGDIKPDNIMFSNGVKLIDFGLSVFCGSEVMNEHLYTVGYVPPEFIFGSEDMKADKSMDVFALGITMLLSMFPQHPDFFNNNKKREYLNKRAKIDSVLLEIPNSILANLIRSMVDYNPLVRPSMDSIHEILFGLCKNSDVHNLYNCTQCMCFNIACETFSSCIPLAERVNRVRQIDPLSTDLTLNLASFSTRSFPKSYTIYLDKNFTV